MTEREQISSDELHTALRDTLKRLAPLGGTHRIELNVACDVMIRMIADLLISSGRTADDVDGLAVLFRDKLTTALERRGATIVGHA